MERRPNEICQMFETNAEKELDIEQLEEWLMVVKRRLAVAPKGRLLVSYSNGCPQYQQIVDGKRIYLPASQMELVKALAQKGYDKKALRVLEQEIAVRKKRLKEDNAAKAKGGRTLIGVYEAMGAGRRELVEPLVLPVEEMARRWAAEPYEPKEFRPGDPEHYAKNGLRVRSKSERDAVDEMLDFALYFKYECPLVLKGLGLIHPDFMVMSKRTGQVWIWEHFGKVDDRAYAQDMVKRIEAYHYNGYFEGKNLIYTMESYQQPFNRKEARRIIEQYFI